MFNHVWVYFAKTGFGYELAGSDIISGLDAFLYVDETYLIEYSYSDIIDGNSFLIYEWDNSQKKRRTVELHRREKILLGMMKDIRNLSNEVIEKILSMYSNDAEELELEKNANS